MTALSKSDHKRNFTSSDFGPSLTAMYNVLEALRAGRALTPEEQTVHDHSLVSVLRQLHDELDAAVAAAYGWPADLPDADILTRLVALNAERAAEEAAGHVRWLRPDYQAPKTPAATQTALSLPAATPGLDKPKPSRGKEPWPRPLAERVQAVERALHAAAAPVTADALARRFARARPAELAEILETLTLLGRAHQEAEFFSS